MGFIFYFVSPKQTLCLIPYPVRLPCTRSIIYNNLYPSHSSSLIYYIFCRFFYLVINANTYTIQYLSITYKTSKLRKSSFTVCPVAVHINKIKNRQEWFQSDLEEEYLHEIYPLYSPGEEDDEYEDEDGEKCSIMPNNV